MLDSQKDLVWRYIDPGPASSFLPPKRSLALPFVDFTSHEWKKEVLHLCFLTFPPKLSAPGDRLIRLVSWTGPVQAYYNYSTRLHAELVAKLCSIVLRFRQSVTKSELILGRVKSLRGTCCVHPCHTHLSDWSTTDWLISLGIKETAILMSRYSSFRRAQCLCEVQKWMIKTPALVSISLGVTIMKRKKRHFKILLTSAVYCKVNSFHRATENRACEASF